MGQGGSPFRDKRRLGRERVFVEIVAAILQRALPKASVWLRGLSKSRGTSSCEDRLGCDANAGRLEVNEARRSGWPRGRARTASGLKARCSTESSVRRRSEGYVVRCRCRRG